MKWHTGTLRTLTPYLRFPNSGESTGAPASSAVHKIVPDGDLFLDIGGARFLVYSQVLRSASPVFCSMLAPHSPFQESGKLRAAFMGKEPATIKLVEDVSENIFKTVMLALHHSYNQPKTHPNGLGFAQICDMAVLVDKYDLSRALQPHLRIWWSNYSFLATIEGYESLLLVAWAFKEYAASLKIRRHLSMRTKFAANSSLFQHEVTTDGKTDTRSFSKIIPSELIGLLPQCFMAL